TDGRLHMVTSGTRQTTYDYFQTSDLQNGYLQSVTDQLTSTLSAVTSYTRDPMGRPLSETRNGIQTLLGWDAHGDLSSVTPPGKPQHTQTLNGIDLLGAYNPPSAGLSSFATTYTYFPDRQLNTVTRPDGIVLTNGYDSTTGKLSTLMFGSSTIGYGYYPP